MTIKERIEQLKNDVSVRKISPITDHDWEQIEYNCLMIKAFEIMYATHKEDVELLRVQYKHTGSSLLCVAHTETPKAKEMCRYHLIALDQTDVLANESNVIGKNNRYTIEIELKNFLKETSKRIDDLISNI